MSAAEKFFPKSPIDPNELTEVVSHWWSSSLIDESILRSSEQDEILQVESLKGNPTFQKFCSDFFQLCENTKSAKCENWSETETINLWIKPVVKALGWYNNCLNEHEVPFCEEHSFSITSEAKGKRKVKTYRPDVLLFDSSEKVAIVTSQVDMVAKLREARDSSIIPLEAKYWGRLEEERQNQPENQQKIIGRQEDSTKGVSPEQQIINYMSVLEREFGVLTDGAMWRIFSLSKSTGERRRSYNFNLMAFRNHVIGGLDSDYRKAIYVEAAARFFQFFSKQTIKTSNLETSSLLRSLSKTERYVREAEDDLRRRFITAMNFACNGLAKRLGGNPTSDLEKIRSACESLLFNLLFIRFCESRSLLPMRSPSYRAISLGSLVNRIDDSGYDPELSDAENLLRMNKIFKDIGGYTGSGTEIFDQVMKLITAVIDGTNSETESDFGLKIDGFQKSVFAPDDLKLLRDNKIENSFVISLLFELNFVRVNELKRKYKQIPYSYFSARQIGSIYESLLEFKLGVANHDHVFIDEKWVKVPKGKSLNDFKDVPKAKSGDLFFRPDKTDKKAMGSYFTKHFIVENMVRNALETLVDDRSVEELFELRVCDPALGSGHFLNEVLNQLTISILEANQTDPLGDKTMLEMDVKNLVLERCIYGVDYNIRAVRLAMLSLWLETARFRRPLCDLTTKIQCGHSLVEPDYLKQKKTDKNIFWSPLDWNGSFSNIMNNGGFDLIIGNPPWGAKMAKQEAAYLKKKYKKGIVRMVDTFMYFILEGLSRTRPEGIMSMILPDVVMYQPHNRKIREIILSKYRLESVINLGNVFDKVIRPSGIVLVRNQNTLNPDVKVLDVSTLSENQKVKLINSDKSFSSVDQEEMSEIPGSLLVTSNIEGYRLLGKLAKRIKWDRLGDMVDKDGIQRGVSPDFKDAFIVNESVVLNSNLERKHIKKVLTGGTQVKRYSIEDNDNLRLIYIDDKVNLNSIPNIKKHIDGFADKITCKEVAQDKHSIYRLHRPRDKKIFLKKNKILGVITEDEIVLARDSNKFFATDGLYIFNVKKGINPDYLLGICNSSLFVFLYRLLAKEKGRVMAQVKPTVIENLIVAKYSSKGKQQSSITKLSASIQKDLEKLKREPSGTKKKALFDTIQKNQRDLDKAVLDLYKLTAEERQMINQELGASSQRIKSVRKKVKNPKRSSKKRRTTRTGSVSTQAHGT